MPSIQDSASKKKGGVRLDTALWFIWCDCMYNHILLDEAIPKEPEVVEHLRLRRTRDGYLTVQLVGHYDDTLRRRDGAWRLHRRNTTFQ